MKKFSLYLFVISLILFSCSKNEATPEPLPELFPGQTNSLLGTWTLTKTYQQFYRNNLLIYQTTTTPVGPATYNIQFTNEMFQNISNTKKFYDSTTGISYASSYTGPINQGKWSVFHKDSVAVGAYKYFIKKLTTTESELFRNLYVDTSDFSKTTATWYLKKVY